tara:strand:+ start:1005 stop:1805 length:801 start_codon:yes stop_codon:yes gene_type:complete
MEKIKISKAADILFYSRANIKRIKELPKDCTPKSSQEAYDIQDELTKRYLSEYKNTFVIGKKIGCTNEAAKIQLNIKDSFYGNIFSNNISKSNTTIDPKKYIGPFVEPEFSFVMKDELDITKAPYSPQTVYKSVLSVIPSIEVVDSRYEDWTSIGVNNLIADNAVHAHWIYGEEKKELNFFNFNNHSVDLLINGKLIEKGNASAVMGNPINSLTWLINTLASVGKVLPKNNYISTGTCTKAISISRGDKVTADFGKLGIVKFEFKE